MPDVTAVRMFFGDGERDFALPPDRIRELERSVGGGVGAISRRVFGGEFSYAEVSETIRVALVGGGASPQDAAELVALYVAGRPLSESHPVATAILEALWWGAKRETVDGSH